MGDARPVTVADLDPRDNSLNALRLVFATAVIVSHTWPLGGYGPDPTILGVKLGSWAVGGFFAISGYLIAGSRLHHTIVPFLERRVLRIMPAFWVNLVVTAFVFAPLAAAVAGTRWQAAAAVRYLHLDWTLRIHAGRIAGTLGSVPYGPTWNGSLWTLYFEFVCYLVVAALLTVARLRRPALWVVFAAAVAAAVWTHDPEGPTDLDRLAPLLAIFLAGSLLALHARRVPLTWKLAVPAVVVLGVAAAVGQFAAVGAFPLAYICLYLGKVLPCQWVGRQHDLSYGIYLYGFPVGQLLVLLHGNTLPRGVLAAVTVVATVPFAAFSWFAVERPAQRLAPRLDAATRRLLRAGAARRRPGPAPDVPLSADAAPR